MNTITRHFLICGAIAALGLFGGTVWAQNAPATPPRATAPAVPAAPPAPAEAPATPPAATGDATGNADANDTVDDGPRPADDTSDADPPIVWTRDQARGWRGGARFHDDNELVTIGGSSSLPAGGRSDAVVSVFGSATSAGEVRDSVVSVFGDTRVEGGKVGDASVSVLGNNYVNAEVDGDVVAVLGDVELGPNARVRGNAVVVGGELIRDPNAVLGGSVQHVMTIPDGVLVGFKSWLKNCLRYLRPLAFAPDLGWAWTIALGVLALYALFAVMFRDPLDRCVQTLQERPGETIVASLLAVLLTPVLYVVLIITAIGIAFIPIVGFGMFLATLFGKAVVLAWIGRGVLKLANQNERTHSAIAVLIGGAIALLLYTVPVLGFLVFNLIGILGFGAVVYTLMLVSRAKRRSTPPASAPGTGARPPGVGPAPAGAAAGAGTANLGDLPAGATPYTAGFSAAEAAAGGAGFAAASTSGGAAGGAASGPDAAFAERGGTQAGGEFAGIAGGQDSAGSAGAAGATQDSAGFAGGASGFGGAGQSDGGGIGGVGGGATTPPTNGSADALSLPRAGFWIRILALLIDTILVGVVFNALDHHTKLQLIALAAYGAIMWKLKGTTVGGIVCNLKIVRLDGREIDWSTAIVRALGCFLSLIVCGLGFIWIAFDPGRQAWHDKIAGTAVVRVPQGVSLL
jgi:RDD family protein